MLLREGEGIQIQQQKSTTMRASKHHVLKDSAVDNTISTSRKKKKRTFADVATKLGTTTTIARQNNNAALGDWLPQFGVKARGSEEEKASASSRLPPPSSDPFEDWTPCTTVRISCETRHHAALLKKNTSIRDVVEADLRHITSGIHHYHRVSNRDDENSLWLAMTAATSTWTFPQRCMSPRVFRSLPDDVKKDRRHDWKEALCSAYDMYKSATEPFVFYVSSPEYQSSRSSHPKYTVMFATSNTSSRKQRMHAVLSQSTKGLRNLLHSCGIGFEAPLLKDPLKSKDQGARSILVFQGALRVHGMFDILLNKAIGGMSHDDCDVPCVHAPRPFRNATMVKIPCQIQSSTTITIGGSHTSWIPPWTIRRILQCLVATQEYTIWFTPVPDVSRGCMNSYGECLLCVEYKNGMFTAVKASASLAPV